MRSEVTTHALRGDELAQGDVLDQRLTQLSDVEAQGEPPVNHDDEAGVTQSAAYVAYRKHRQSDQDQWTTDVTTHDYIRRRPRRRRQMTTDLDQLLRPLTAITDTDPLQRPDTTHDDLLQSPPDDDDDDAAHDHHVDDHHDDTTTDSCSSL